jgi:hypothetical protein
VTTFEGVTSEQLLDSLLTLQYVCGRSKLALTKRRRHGACFLMTLIQTELDLRGFPHPDRTANPADDGLVA